MTTPSEAIERLQELSSEMDSHAGMLARVERDLEPVARDYEDFVAAHEIGLYEKSTNEAEFRLPSEALRVKLAHRDMPAELYGRFRALTASRRRLEKRIGTLKVSVDAQRSILSALKAELEATR